MRFYLFSLCFLISCISCTQVWASTVVSKQPHRLSFNEALQVFLPKKTNALRKKIEKRKRGSEEEKQSLSRYGNPDIYRVKGQPYRIMKNSVGYKVRGIASWYGAPFHRQKTSSGEQYDMYAMTAAHKTLPLPTYVRVKNLDNGRVVVVKVNDRGPFYKDRVIDLSYAAGAKLGFLEKGITLVEIEALTKSAADANYYIQAGAFSSAESAALLQNKIAKLTPSPVKVEKHEKHYIVRVGPLANKQSSDHLKKKMSANGIQGAFSVLL